MKIILAYASVILFGTGFWICEIIYKYDLIKWTHLRMNLISLVICGVLYVADKCATDRRLKLPLEIGIGLSIADVIDRLCFDITTFSTNDFITIGFTIAFSIYNYVKRK